MQPQAVRDAVIRAVRIISLQPILATLAHIQKRIGILSEQKHSYGALIVEVDDTGSWWVSVAICTYPCPPSCCALCNSLNLHA